MQSTLCITIANPIVPLKSAHNYSCQLTAHRPSPESRIATMRATSVNYNSAVSVFPAEGCDTVGGDACLADMYPEVKLQQITADDQGRMADRVDDSDLVDREYLEYDDSTTVILEENSAAASTKGESIS
ncbi:Light-regulated protein 1, chloroplastic [Linum grandiflorum]